MTLNWVEESWADTALTFWILVGVVSISSFAIPGSQADTSKGSILFSETMNVLMVAVYFL